MREHDDAYIVIDRGNGGGQIGSFILGALVGAGVALLFAPRSGEETQEDIRERAARLRSAAEDRVRDAQKRLEHRMDQARDGVQSRIEDVKEAVESGRQAAHDARGELEKRVEKSKAAYRAGIDAAREAARSDEAEEVEA
ncbi:MAG: YtxH domain-containing protein [Longimicrobiales bacterium]